MHTGSVRTYRWPATDTYASVRSVCMSVGTTKRRYVCVGGPVGPSRVSVGPVGRGGGRELSCLTLLVSLTAPLLFYSFVRIPIGCPSLYI